MILRRHVICLGLSQLICWGISFYLIGIFGEPISRTTGWPRPAIYGGFSVALLVMAIASPAVGQAIDRFGGGRVMALGSLLMAAACASLALAQSLPLYFLAWAAMGLAMRATLYDAAFAALARIAGPAARPGMTQITLLGGLASTCFWPLGQLLIEWLGWRGALGVYALFALATLPLHLALPGARATQVPAARDKAPDSASPPGKSGKLARPALYALIAACVSGLNAGMTAHMIEILIDLGIGATLAVTITALRGIGQTLARLVESALGGRFRTLDVNLFAALLLLASFLGGLASGLSLAAAVFFCFGYGAGNGLLTVTRGTLPLVLFAGAGYGRLVGRLLVPSFLASAAAPFALAYVIDDLGAETALLLATAVVALLVAASFALRRLGPG